MRNVATALFAALVLSGCGAFHPVPPLNGEERAQAELLVPLFRGMSVCVSADAADAAVVDVANRSLQSIGVNAECRVPSGPNDVGLFIGPPNSVRDEAGVAWWLSLGLIAGTEASRDVYPCRVTGPSGREIVGACSVDGPMTMYGWAGLFRGMTRDWQVVSAGHDSKGDAASNAAAEARFGLCLAGLLAGAIPAPPGR